ncbi:hypothetical protein [Loktanella sp. R86503]|uniref:hypothetical protein n=1 Tax=Loktanella sp. R86503 TaxID=3093847 RepID=UPI0036DF63CB
MHDPTADALLELLKKERKSIMSGDFDSLPEFAKQKYLLSQSLSTTALSAPISAHIQTDLKRNSQLLLAICDGIKSAQSRLKAISEVRTGLSLYKANGERQIVACRYDTLERKA